MWTAKLKALERYLMFKTSIIIYLQIFIGLPPVSAQNVHTENVVLKWGYLWQFKEITDCLACSLLFSKNCRIYFHMYILFLLLKWSNLAFWKLPFVLCEVFRRNASLIAVHGQAEKLHEIRWNVAHLCPSLWNSHPWNEELCWYPAEVLVFGCERCRWSLCVSCFATAHYFIERD